MADKIELSEDSQKSLFKEFYKANKRLLAQAFPNLTADLSNVGGGTTVEGSVFNLTSTTPSGMLEADVQTLIDQKIATKVATIPPNTTTVYKYTPRPFFAGLAQPPVTANLPIGASVVKAWNSDDSYSYSDIETTPIIALAEGKVFSAQLIHRSSSNYDTVLSSWKIDDNGTLSNQKYEIQYGYNDSSRYPTAMVASADSSFIVIAMSNKKVRTIVYNKVTARYELANEFTVTYNISNLHLTGDSSELLITFNHDTQIGKSYKAQGGSWVEYTSIDSYNSLEDSILSKDGKKFIAFINQYDSETTIKVVNRTNLSSSLDVPNSSNSDIHGYTDSMHVGKLRISGDGKVLYVGSNNTIKTYSINEDNTFTLLEEVYSGSSMFATSYDVSLDGRTIAVVSEDGKGVTVYRKDVVEPSNVILDESFDDNSRGWALQGNPIASVSGGSLHMESGDSSSASAMLTLADEVPATKLKITITGSEAQNVPAQLVFTAADNTSHGVQLNTVGNIPTIYTVDTPIAIKSIRITPHDTSGYTVYDLKIEKVS